MKIAKPDVLVNLFGREVEPTFHISLNFIRAEGKKRRGGGYDPVEISCSLLSSLSCIV